AVLALSAGDSHQRAQRAATRAGRKGARAGPTGRRARGRALMRTWVLGEFGTPEEMVRAARRLRELGYKRLDTYSPYPVEGTSEALGLPRSRVALFTLCGGIGGAKVGYRLQWF